MIFKLQHTAEKIINRYFIPFSLTILIHLIFIGILIVVEMSKPEKITESEIIIDFSPEDIPEILLKSEELKYIQEHDFQEDIKNIEKNLAEKKISEKDYYNEAKELLKSVQGKEIFKANDYRDLRWLVKDYSSEVPDIDNWDKAENEQQKDKQQKQAAYSGHTVISYDLGGRKALRLPVPAYKCYGYGKVTIEIQVNQKGQVVSAKIIENSASLNENCLPQSALEAALRSRFQPSEQAPTLQKGFIYYTFVAQ
jgi:TonB family protein